MLYDLNIPWTPSTDRASLEQTLAFSASLGYNVVALNHTITPPIPAQITNPLPKFDSPPRSTSETASTPLGPAPTASTPRLPTVLHRATVLISDPSQNFRIAALATHYDIFAVRPITEKAFSNVCLTTSETSIISLDLTARFTFHFRPKPCMAAVSRGVRFEICYGQALVPNGVARANFIANFSSLVRATKGRGLIISSEAKSALGLRGPADVANLLSVWGLPKERGMEALGTGPRGVVVNESLKRTSYKGVVNIVEIAPRKDDGQKGHEDAATEKKGTGAKGGKQQKRKNDEVNGGPLTAGGQASISKRQAKKLRMAQQQSGRDG